MSWKQYFWSLLAGASLAITACDDDGEPQPPVDVYGVPIDMIFDEPAVEEPHGDDDVEDVEPEED